VQHLPYRISPSLLQPVVVLAPHSLAGTAALRGIAAALDVDPDSDIPAG